HGTSLCRKTTRLPPFPQGQKRASLFAICRVTQKLTPSLHAPMGKVLAPVEKVPRAVKSAAFQSETAGPKELATRTRCPSNAAARGTFKPLPVSVASTAPLEARTTETELLSRLAAQMFVPSKTGNCGPAPIVTVCRTAPEPSSLRRVWPE